MPSVEIQEQCDALKASMAKVIAGQDDAVEMMLTALLAGGHVLMEGVPGTAKTLMVKALCLLFDLKFKRVQFTPDLMPSDVIGNNVLDMTKSTFTLRKGPIFTDFLLADEINRTPPKTQAALLECMEERQTTIDGERHPLGAEFTVFATQNPIEYEGTYPLPEAQLDRFMTQVVIDYPSVAEEEEILRRFNGGFDPLNLEAVLQPLMNRDELVVARAGVREVEVEGRILSYIAAITGASRVDPNCILGASPRASVSLLSASKARAALAGRAFVIPDDVKGLACPILRHRLMVKPEAELDGYTADDVIAGILESLEVPR